MSTQTESTEHQGGGREGGGGGGGVKCVVGEAACLCVYHVCEPDKFACIKCVRY